MTITFECRSVGFACEWGLYARSREELLERFREHAQCAHKVSELPPDLVRKLELALTEGGRAR